VWQAGQGGLIDKPELSGTAAAPITIRNYPGDALPPIFSGADPNDGFGRIYGPSSYVVLDGLEFEYRLARTVTNNFNAFLTIGGFPDSGPEWANGTGYSILHTTVRNCKFRQAASPLTRGHEIYLSGGNRYTIIEDCEFVGASPTGAADGHNHGVHAWNGDIVDGHHPPSKDLLIRRCIFRNWAPTGGVGLLLWDESHNHLLEATISHCSFIGNTSPDISLKEHGAITITDCATDSAYELVPLYLGPNGWLHEGTALNPTGDRAYTNGGSPTNDPTWHNAFSCTFTADYYLTASSPGQNAASDGTDCGALNDTPSSGSASAANAPATGTANDATYTAPAQAFATLASSTGAAAGAAMRLGVPAATASGTGTAVTVPMRYVQAGSPAGTGTAIPASVTTYVPAGKTDVPAEMATATGAAGSVTAKVSAAAATAAGSGVVDNANTPAPPRWACPAEYVIELFDSSATFGPNNKLGELWDMRNLGWSRYDRMPGRGFFTLYQDSPHLASIIPLITHVRVTRVAPSGNVEVFNGIVSDYNSTGDDVVFDIYDYVSLLSLSRSGYRTLYPTKLVGSEIVSPEWLLAKNATNSPLGFVATGTIEDPLGDDNFTPIKTNAQFGLMDQMRLSLFYDLAEMGRANTINQVTYEISRTAPFTFNFWKNKGTAVGIPLVLNGTVSEYQHAPNWAALRNDLATLGTTVAGGVSEVVKADGTSAAAFGLRQGVFTIKTLAGASGAVEADQQQAVAARFLKSATEGAPSLWLTLVPGVIEPFTDWDICDTFPVEIVNGADSITGNWRVVGARAIADEPGERMQVLVAPVLT
jgi:hypothetical protein